MFIDFRQIGFVVRSQLLVQCILVFDVSCEDRQFFCEEDISAVFEGQLRNRLHKSCIFLLQWSGDEFITILAEFAFNTKRSQQS